MKLPEFLKENFLYFLLISFVFISSSALALSGLKAPGDNHGSLLQEKKFPAVPKLKSGTDSFPIISAQSVLAIDLNSGVSLYEKDADKVLLPASTTKIVTALVSMDYYDNKDILTVDGERVEGQKMGLVKGEKISAGNLLHGLLIFSANDAAEVLAANYCKPQGLQSSEEGCGRDTFIEAMNEKVVSLGLESTKFTNPSGLEDGEHRSTARDLVRVAIVAMKDKRFSEIVATREFVAESVDGRIVHRMENINELIGKVEGVLGVKTGWTENARENLVTYVVREDKTLMIALLASQDRFGETEELIEWIYSNYDWQKVNSPETVSYSP